MARMGVMRNAYRVLVRKPEGTRPDGRCRLDERIILKFILNKQDLRAWTELIWLGTWTRGELVVSTTVNFGGHKTAGNF